MRDQRVPEWASQETASGLQNGCRMFAHCTDLIPASPDRRDHVDHGHPRQPAENHLRRDARERRTRAARVLRGPPLQPLDCRQCRWMARRGAAVRHRAAVHPHQPRELEADWMSVPPFTSIAEHRERRIAYESIPGLSAHRDLLHRQSPRSLSHGYRIVQFVLNSSVRIGPNRTQRWPSNFIIWNCLLIRQSSGVVEVAIPGSVRSAT